MMRTWADSTLMSMKKADLIECLRCAEHNQAVAEERLAQHIENVKDCVPVVRCRDCERCKKYTNMFGENGLKCELLCVDIQPNDFCSYGERR